MNAESNKEVTKASYQATASEFALKVANFAPISSIQEFIKLLPAEAKIIDIGCGSGRDAKIFSDAGIDVLGIDYCPNLIQIAESHAPLANFQLMDIESINLPPESFNGAWAACSLNHIPKNKIANVFMQINSLLKEHAYFYLALKKGTGEILEQDNRYAGNHQKFWAYYEETELKNHLETAGFKILDFQLVEKQFEYHTHSAYRIFCQKLSR